MKRMLSVLLCAVMLICVCASCASSETSVYVVPEETDSTAGMTEETGTVTLEELMETVPATEQATEQAAETTTEEATAAPTTETVTTAAPTAASDNGEEAVQHYVLNTNTKKFHKPDCPSVKKIKDTNRQDYEGTCSEIIAMGYAPCKRCLPTAVAAIHLRL